MEVGKINRLPVVEVVDRGYVLMEEDERVFLPREDAREEHEVGEELKVFIYRDAKRELMASEYIPYAVAGEFDFLTVTKVSSVGALLDWGFSRPLFLPSREQTERLLVGRSYLVRVLYDENTKQVIATMKIDDYLGQTQPSYEMNDEVEILVARETEIGYRVIVDDAFWGIIYHSEIFEKVRYGMRAKGYVKCVRDDWRVDVALQKQGYMVVDELGDRILDALEKNGGFLPLNDHTDSNVIYNKLGCSKKSFKKTIGTLYRRRLIAITPEGIVLASE